MHTNQYPKKKWYVQKICQKQSWNVEDLKAVLERGEEIKTHVGGYSLLCSGKLTGVRVCVLFNYKWISFTFTKEVNKIWLLEPQKYSLQFQSRVKVSICLVVKHSFIRNFYLRQKIFKKHKEEERYPEK